VNISTAFMELENTQPTCHCILSELCWHYLQSFKQHVLESDPVRVKQIIERALEDASWVVKKVCV
jgi:hypothetical protein